MKLTDPRPQLILILLLLLTLLLTGCRSKHSVVKQKESTVTELQQNGIEKSEQIQKDVSLVRIEHKNHFSIVPVNEQKLSRVIYKGDTLSFNNARLDLGSERNDVTEHDRSLATSTTKDNSTRTFQAESQEKFKNKKIKSASWGLNLAIIVGVIILIGLAYIEFKIRRE